MRMRSTIPMLLATFGAMQPNAVIVRVVDSHDRPIPYALVSIGNDAAGRVADETGTVRLRVDARDSLRLSARRIGFREFVGWVKRDGDAPYLVRLQSVQALDTMAVTAVRDTPLARSGFYDRMQRVQRGAITGEFITPEELESRNASHVSQILQGRRGVKVGSTRTDGRARAVLLGRGGTCGMTILLDGVPMKGMVEKSIASSLPQSIDARGTAQSPAVGGVLSVDEIVDVGSVAAIEIYASSANAPAELIPLTGQGSCGIVAIWTGGRR